MLGWSSLLLLVAHLEAGNSTIIAILHSVPFCAIADALWEYQKGSLIVLGDNSTAGIFATYPSKHLSLVNGFFDQVRRIRLFQCSILI